MRVEDRAVTWYPQCGAHDSQQLWCEIFQLEKRRKKTAKKEKRIYINSNLRKGGRWMWPFRRKKKIYSESIAAYPLVCFISIVFNTLFLRAYYDNYRGCHGSGQYGCAVMFFYRLDDQPLPEGRRRCSRRWMWVVRSSVYGRDNWKRAMRPKGNNNRACCIGLRAAGTSKVSQ